MFAYNFLISANCLQRDRKEQKYYTLGVHLFSFVIMKRTHQTNDAVDQLTHIIFHIKRKKVTCIKFTCFFSHDLVR